MSVSKEEGRARKPGQKRKLAGEVKPEDDGPAIVVALDGFEHVVVINQLTGLDTRILDQGLEVTPLGLLNIIANGGLVQPHIMAMVVCLARRQAGEKRLTYEEVAETMTYGGVLASVVNKPALAGVTTVEEPGDPKD